MYFYWVFQLFFFDSLQRKNKRLLITDRCSKEMKNKYNNYNFVNFLDFLNGKKYKYSMPAICLIGFSFFHHFLNTNNQNKFLNSLSWLLETISVATSIV